MSDDAQGAEAAPTAWQPLTFGGVAAFADASLGRLMAFELTIAFLVAATTVWFLHRAYCPVILQAAQKMPETARLADGSLQGVPDTVIAESKFLAFAVTPEAAGEVGQAADLQIQLRPNDVRAGSVIWPDWGLDFPYDRGKSVNLGRSNLESQWGAWQPVLLAGVGTGVFLSLLLVWIVLAVVYMVPAKFIAFFADRRLTWGGAWRLASAALWPGALVMTGALLLYGWNVMDLVKLSTFLTIHIIMGWIYLVGGTFKLRSLFPNPSKRNPFLAKNLQ